MQNISALDRYCAMVASLKQKNVPPGGEGMIDPICAALPKHPGKIVDLGCNTGWVAHRIAERFADSDVLGVDINPDMIATAREIATLEGSAARFECTDGSRLIEVASDADAIVCGGSAAFFEAPVAVYRGVASCLRDGGTFIDGHYLYDATTPPNLRSREKEMFGLGWMPSGIAEIAAVYEAAGLMLQSVRRFGRFRFESSPGAALARDILLSNTATRPLVEGMIARRALIDELSEYRHPYLVTARKDRPGPDTGTQDGDLEKVLAALDLFAEPVAPLPMAVLRTIRPYEFLAYIGDSDAAPGGGRAVARLGNLLGECGVPADGSLLDIGCFTGLSSIVLANSFADVTGIDIEPTFLATASRVGQRLGSSARFLAVDGAATGFPTGAFDAVTMTATLAYSPKPRAILDECRRVLKPGGVLAEFLYHHFATGDDDEAAIRRAVGPDVRLSPLSDKLSEFEAAGFRLVALERAPTSNAGTAARAAIATYITAREAARDPSKTEADLAEFGALFDLYAGRLSGDRTPPAAYLCLFVADGDFGAEGDVPR